MTPDGDKLDPIRLMWPPTPSDLIEFVSVPGDFHLPFREMAEDRLAGRARVEDAVRCLMCG